MSAEMEYVPPDKPASEFTREERMALFAASHEASLALAAYMARLMELEAGEK